MTLESWNPSLTIFKAWSMAGPASFDSLQPTRPIKATRISPNYVTLPCHCHTPASPVMPHPHWISTIVPPGELTSFSLISFVFWREKNWTRFVHAIFVQGPYQPSQHHSSFIKCIVPPNIAASWSDKMLGTGIPLNSYWTMAHVATLPRWDQIVPLHLSPCDWK